jgi:hypothetical protein
MALRKGYFDASFTEPTGVASIGGYVGTEDQWAKVEKAWNENLDLWGLEEFNLAPLLAGQTSIGRTNAEICALSFARIISGSELHSIASAVRESDWQLKATRARYFIQFPRSYYHCFDMLLDVLDEHMRLEFSNDRVDIVMDRDAPEEPAQEIFKKWKARSQQFVSLTFADRTRCRMIQCADLQAGTEGKGWLASQAWNYPETSNLFALAQGHKGRSAFWSIETQMQIENVMANLEKRERAQ